MISRYAVLDENDIVKELVDIDEDQNLDSSISTKEIVQRFFPNKKIVKQTQQTDTIFIGSKYENNSFNMPQPYPSWKWNGKEWVAPKQYPKNGKVNFWNEETKNWEIFVDGEK